MYSRRNLKGLFQSMGAGHVFKLRDEEINYHPLVAKKLFVLPMEFF